jgi:hypothetical protein
LEDLPTSKDSISRRVKRQELPRRVAAKQLQYSTYCICIWLVVYSIVSCITVSVFWKRQLELE